MQRRPAASVHVSFVGLTLTPRGRIARALEGPDRAGIMQKIESAVALARTTATRSIGFGGYTSIISANCRRVRTDGNRLDHRQFHLTTGMGILAVPPGGRRLGIEMANASLAWSARLATSPAPTPR